MSNHKYSYNERFFSEDTIPGWYWSGFTLSDGCIRFGQRNNTTLSMQLKGLDFGHLEKFKGAINATHPITLYNQVDKRYGKVRSTARLVISLTTETIQDLGLRGIVPLKTKHLEIPMGLGEEQAKSLVRGYFDGDGCISIYKGGQKFSVCGFCKEPLGQINDYLCLYAGLPHKDRVYAYHTKTLYSLSVGNRKEVLTVMDWMYSNSTPETRLDRKYEKYLKIPR